jgi:hypothetical protein
MWLVYLSILFVIALYFWDSIKMMINNVLATKMDNGMIWFITLVIINIVLLIFIYIFTYLKTNEPGPVGVGGLKGFPGQEGDGCKIKPECPVNNLDN